MAVRIAILAALTANALLAVLKFVVAAVSGSSAMQAEGYHSVGDTLNQVLLLWGVYAARRAPDDQHPFGYGKERYFWSFVVAIVVFGAAGALSVVEGVEQVLHGNALTWEQARWAYVVLGGALLFESGSLTVSLREARKKKRELQAKSVRRALTRSKDATLATVVLEDVVALMGILVAAGGIGLALLTQDGRFDGAASVMIGLLLLTFAFVLTRRNRDLIVGESADPQAQLEIIRAMEAHPHVQEVVSLRTMHLSPKDLLIGAEINFTDGLDTDQVEAAIDEVERRIREHVPSARKIFIEPEHRHDEAD